MLFSSTEVSAFVNANFEPAWESLRPVPTVTIDFGNGRTVTRTLHGNIATYVCRADGSVVDVLPGIYTPGPYCLQLGALARLADSFRFLPAVEAEKKLRAYHTARTVAGSDRLLVPASGVGFAAGAGTAPAGWHLPDNARAGVFGVGGFGGGAPAGRPVVPQVAGGLGGAFGRVAVGFGGRPALGAFGGGGGKFGIERPVELALVGRTFPETPGPAPLPPANPAGLAGSPILALDTVINETERRHMVHARLAASGLVTPDGLKKWLFKEVLNADLDDPTLGLKDVLEANYPFAEEDRKSAGQ